MEPERLAENIVAHARRLGFHKAATGPAGPLPRQRLRLYREWLRAGHAGEMGYLHGGAAERRDPRALLAGAQGLVCVALSYLHPEPAPMGDGGLRGRIARYARGEDYHLVLKRRLEQLAAAIAAEIGRPLAHRTCVDSAPLLEREVAARAGLGFQAKNTLLITPGVGSYTVLGELLLDVPLPEYPPKGQGEGAQAGCGRCARCLSACPTGALVGAHVLDARRCISYLTIELRGAIPVPLRPLMGTWIFGCDICQEVCPYNAHERPGDPAFLPRRPGGTGAASRERSFGTPELLPLLQIGAAQYRQLVRRTALRRISREQLQRNAAVALGNAGTAREVPALLRALGQAAPLVRRHVAWALGQIAGRGLPDDLRAQVRQVLGRALAAEADAEARGELEQALRASYSERSSNDR